MLLLIIYKKKNIYVYLDNKVLFRQPLLRNSKIFTFYYVIHVLLKLGLYNEITDVCL